MPDELGRLLTECEIDEGAVTREGTIAEATHRLSAKPSPLRRFRRRLASAVGALAVAGFALSPAGSAVAEDIAQLVGIGDEPSDRFEAGMIGSISSDGRVFGLGTTPSGIPFELAHERTTLGGRKSTRTQSCVHLSYPDTKMDPSGASCLTDAALRGFERGHVMSPIASIGPAGLGEGSDFVVSFTGSADVDHVEVSYPMNGEVLTTEAKVAPFMAAPAQTAKASAYRGETPLVMGVAFLPSTPFRALPPPPQPSSLGERLRFEDLKLDPEATNALLGQIEVTAYDADGEVLAAQDLRTSRWAYIPIASRLGGI